MWSPRRPEQKRIHALVSLALLLSIGSSCHGLLLVSRSQSFIPHTRQVVHGKAHSLFLPACQKQQRNGGRGGVPTITRIMLRRNIAREGISTTAFASSSRSSFIHSISSSSRSNIRNFRTRDRKMELFMIGQTDDYLSEFAESPSTTTSTAKGTTRDPFEINGELNRPIITEEDANTTARTALDDFFNISDVAENGGGQVEPEGMLPLAPPLSFDKFLTMQVGEDKRVVVTIRYCEDSGLRPFFLTAAKKIKSSYPDVIIEKELLPSVEKDNDDETFFEVLVDGKVIIGKGRNKRQSVRRASGGNISDKAGGRSVFVSMEDLDLAVAKARRRRRPTTLYDARSKDIEEETTAAMRLQMLRRNKHEKEAQPWID